MVSKTIKEVRADDVLTDFVKHPCVFLTLTTPDVVDVFEIRKRWRSFRHWFQEVNPGCKYIMNYEIHPRGHGWHIHAVFTQYIPLKKYLPRIRSFGFGRVDVRRVTSKGVSDYLTKHALKAYRGVSKVSSELLGRSVRLRLVNTSRGLPVLSDYHWRSAYQDRFLSVLPEVMQLHLPYRHKMTVASILASFNPVCSYLEYCRLVRMLRNGENVFDLKQLNLRL